MLERNSPLHFFLPSLHHCMAARITLLLSLSLLTGCFSTHLLQEHNTAELQRLVTSTERSLALVVKEQHKDSSRGHQFLLGILPVARVFTDNIAETVVAKLQYHAGKEGLGLVARSAPSSAAPRLDVTIVNAAVNGYDLIIFRRPSAHVTLRGTLYTAGGGEYTCEERGSDSTLSRFAFSSDLNQVLESAVGTATERLLHCLGLSSQHTLHNSVAPSPTADEGQSL